MKKSFAIIPLLFALSLFVACQNTSPEKIIEKADSTPVTEEKVNADKPAGAKYTIKSGIISYKSEMMMMKQNLTVYFDDFGKKTLTEINIDMFGQKIKTQTLVEGDYVYTWDSKKKEGSKVKIDQNSPENVNFTELTDELRKKYNIREVGNADVLGRNCKVYEMTMNESGVKGKYYIWNGLTLKTEATAQGMNIKMEAVKLEESPNFPADQFDLPKGITFKEISREEATSAK